MSKKLLYIKPVTLGVTLCLAACASSYTGEPNALINETQRHFIANPAQFLPSLVETPPAAFQAPRAQAWWKNFQDPYLDHLMIESRNRSFDVRRALTNVQQAEAIIRGERADLFPSVGFSSQTSVSESGGSNIRTALGLSWDIDVFGQTRQQILEARSVANNQKELLRDIQRLVLARTAQSYIAYRTADARIELNENNLQRLYENRKRIQTLVQAGYGTRLDLSRAETQISEVQSDMAVLKGQRTAIKNALALLVQKSPDMLGRELTTSPTRPQLPDRITAPNLDYIIRHRPDIRAAEWELVTAIRSKRAAQLALYPDISLGGEIFNLTPLSSFSPTSNISAALISTVLQPLLGRGRLLANIDQENAQVHQAWIDYEETAQSAVLDIDTSIKNWTSAREQLGYDEQTLNSSIEAQELAQTLFFAGEESFTALIVAEQTRLQTQDNYLLTRQSAFDSFIDYSANAIPNW